jgi:ribonuclease BN (tRNA processing enzyme)
MLRVQEPPPTVNGSGAPLEQERGRRVCLLGDTCDSSAIARLAANADVLSHEATFLSSMAEKARLATHSTASQAGDFAARVNAKQLVLTHFSGRYQGADDGDEGDDSVRQAARDIHAVVTEARAAAAGIVVKCAHDGFTVVV